MELPTFEIKEIINEIYEVSKQKEVKKCCYQALLEIKDLELYVNEKGTLLLKQKEEAISRTYELGEILWAVKTKQIRLDKLEQLGLHRYNFVYGKVGKFVSMELYKKMVKLEVIKNA